MHGGTQGGRGAGEADGIDLPPEAGGILTEIAAIGLDRVKADRGERLELGLERGEIPRAVELEGYAVGRHRSVPSGLEVW